MNDLASRARPVHIDLDDTEHTLIDSGGIGGTVNMMYNDMHMIRAGLNYHFSL